MNLIHVLRKVQLTPPEVSRFYMKIRNSHIHVSGIRERYVIMNKAVEFNLLHYKQCNQFWLS